LPFFALIVTDSKLNTAASSNSRINEILFYDWTTRCGNVNKILHEVNQHGNHYQVS
jgi:hypothetical protein